MRLPTTTSRQQSRRYPGLVVGAVAVLALSACTGSAEDAADDEEGGSGSAPVAAAGSNATTVAGTRTASPSLAGLISRQRWIVRLRVLFRWQRFVSLAFRAGCVVSCCVFPALSIV